jgi:thiamine biosynthesis lipoprotein
MFAAPVRRSPALQRDGNLWRGEFQAMASPCQLLTEVEYEVDARALLNAVAAETWRIEDKFSRYLKGNIVDDINAGDGCEMEVDDETANLLDFSASLHRMSDGRFDISSGALRKVWKFDGSDQVPAQDDIDSVLKVIGWDKISWQRPRLKLRRGMQIDLGGIGKEYAVDRAAEIVKQQTDASSLVNFGGDLVAVGKLLAGGWRVGIESVDSGDSQPERIIHIHSGALATSGDARRFLLKDGVRYGHVLNPGTGWSVDQAPRSVTVAADTCTQAGMLATLAMLRGAGAEQFLQEQSVQYWCMR